MPERQGKGRFIGSVMGVRPIGRLLLFGAVGARVYVVNAKYQTDADEALLSPWLVQPSFLLGLSVDIF